ncbi:bifunctional tryptophan synthase trp1 [Nowakowskiella sp. JEL0078]|nr:bifunctional tryptophan synthase trp1 [Nowakowskiella sp. JEL0078]
MTTLLIDNYDSFTWNLYQYLSELGANVVVHRNDQITISECLALNPRNLVISPGPGHPREAGISIEAIKAFAGKIPIFGVCLGEQSIYEAYGGTVTYAGEIVHGKTSPIAHDGRGIYEGIPQNVEVTRYHSLSGSESTLPDCLEVTSRTDSGVVMGVRHKTFVIDSVQYHPESIASEHGKRMMANFLKWEGGKWADLIIRNDLVKWDKVELQEHQQRTGNSGRSGRGNSVFDGIPLAQATKMNTTGIKAESAGDKSLSSGLVKPTILQTIHQQRLVDVAEARARPGSSELQLSRSIALGAAPAQIDFPARLIAAYTSDAPVAVCAEIKRASPSKGNIDLNAHAPSQALQYAYGGAAVISVLTEPKWFKGSLEDMRQVRLALENVQNRPAVLRKDFVVTRYQVLEARLYGADTLLLIVAILEDETLLDLLKFSRELGMEPLVEVANAKEMNRAVAVGAKVIGVNNRDLHTFTVDMGRTTGLVKLVPEGTILIALSGISARADVEKYYKDGVRAVLVGESLMRSNDAYLLLQDLRLAKKTEIDTSKLKTLVKICGLTSPEDAVHAKVSGADLLGIIFAKNTPREVDIANAAAIVKSVKSNTSHIPLPSPTDPEWFIKSHAAIVTARTRLGRPLVVGVFQNQSVSEINKVVRTVGLDLVQFHGDEDVGLAALISVPVIKAFHIEEGEDVAAVQRRVEESRGLVAIVLLDTSIKGVRGGSGVLFDWKVASAIASAGVPVVLAGGLTAENVAQAVKVKGVVGVDVGSGVEAVKRVKDHVKVKNFVLNAKS